MGEIEITCPRCGETLEASDDVRGSGVECPACHNNFVVPRDAASARGGAEVSEPTPPPAVLPAPASGRHPVAHDLKAPFTPATARVVPQRTSRVVRAGWICFGVGLGLMVVLFLIPVWSPLLFASLVLSIIALAQKEKGGLALLLSTLLLPPVVALLMFVLVIGGCAAAVNKEMKNEGIETALPQRMPVTPGPPSPPMNRIPRVSPMEPAAPVDSTTPVKVPKVPEVDAPRLVEEGKGGVGNP